MKNIFFVFFATVSYLFYAPSVPYGVFIGLNADETHRLNGFQTVVIDATQFSDEHITQMHKNGQEVYSYLNIGSIEAYRPYYERFTDLTLGVYENWPDEKWIDVSQKKWQDFIVDELANNLAQKGIDGFFIDNTDVYYQYPKQEIFDGVQRIIKDLAQKYKLKIMINGGDSYVLKAINEDTIDMLGIYAINQESVYSAIDFENETFFRQSYEENDYFKEYLATAEKAGLRVFMLEYVENDDESLMSEINDYCNENNYYCYISNSIELN